MAETGSEGKLGRVGQSAWGFIGGLTPYAVAALKAVGLQIHYQFQGFSTVFYLVLLLSAALGVMGSILLDSHSKFTAWFHGGSFPIMLNFLFSESLVHQVVAPQK